ncbi:MAG: ATP-binding cassette domain-containing protein [Candidatus Competibacterales bacterium]
MAAPDLAALAWPRGRLAEGLEALARRGGLAPQAGAGLPPVTRGTPLGPWLDAAAGALELEAVAVEASHGEVGLLLRRAGPALLAAPAGGHWLLLRANRRRAVLIAPDLSLVAVAVAVLRDALTQPLEAPVVAQLDPVLAAADLAPERLERVRRTLLDEQLADRVIDGCWLLRIAPGRRFGRQLALAGIPRQLTLILVAHAAQQGVLVLSWWLILQGVLSGRLEGVWLLGWGLLLLSLVPLQVLVLWMQSLVAVTAGSLFKQRLLTGALQLRSEEVRHQGMGQFLGRVLESEALETLVMGGGFAALTAAVELLTALVVLLLIAGDWFTGGLLVLWSGVALLLSARLVEDSRQWRRSHRQMINALVERMVGYRTRLVQQDPADWHREEDRDLASYGELGRRQDGVVAQLAAVVSRGWLVLGFTGLALGLLQGQASPEAIAMVLGGIMLAFKAFGGLVTGIQSLVGVINAWGQVWPLYNAAARRDIQMAPQAAALAHANGPNAAPEAPDGAVGEGVTPAPTAPRPLLAARDLTFRYRDGAPAVLSRCRLDIQRGDRLLLEGPSGGGKSTLAALLTGLRTPTSGLLLLDGLDRQTLGSELWRRRVVAAPQFHDNHVLAETLAFNLLMGRGWPPSRRDMAEAEAVCRALGLGPLLERMPGHLQQMVGESGWQLSHGERSRLFIARALLQGADLIILDESFAALDPENLQRCLEAVVERAPALLVIAHP